MALIAIAVSIDSFFYSAFYRTIIGKMIRPTSAVAIGAISSLMVLMAKLFASPLMCILGVYAKTIGYFILFFVCLYALYSLKTPMTANFSGNINIPEAVALGLFLGIDAAGATVGLVFSSNFSYLFPIIVGLANTIFIIVGQYFGSILKTMPRLQKRGGKMKLYSYLKMLQEKGINTFPEEQVRQEMLTTPVPEISLTQDGLCGVRLGKDGKDWVAFVTNSFEERPDLLPNGKRGQVIEP